MSDNKPYLSENMKYQQVPKNLCLGFILLQMDYELNVAKQAHIRCM